MEPIIINSTFNDDTNSLSSLSSSSSSSRKSNDSMSQNGANLNHSQINNFNQNQKIESSFYRNNIINGFSIELIPKGYLKNYFSNVYPPEIDHLLCEHKYKKLIKRLNKAYFPLHYYIITTILILIFIGSIYPFILYHNYSLDLTCTLFIILFIITCYLSYRTFYNPSLKSIAKKNMIEILDRFNQKHKKFLKLTLEQKEGESYGITKDNITVKIHVLPQKNITPQQPEINENNFSILSTSPKLTTPETKQKENNHHHSIEIESIPTMAPPFILNPSPKMESPKTISTKTEISNPIAIQV